MRTTNDILQFHDCFFNYSSIDRAVLIEIDRGKGSIRCFCSRFFFCRLGGSAGDALIHFNGDTAQTFSLIRDCQFEGVIDGSAEYVVFKITNPQLVKFQGNCVILRQAEPRMRIFGQPGFQKLACLLVTDSVFLGPVNARDLSVIGNLWTRDDEEKLITFAQCTMLVIRIMQYNTFLIDLVKLTDTIESRVRFINCAFDGNDQISFLFKMGEPATMNITLHGCHSISPSREPLMKFTQEDPGNLIRLFLTCNHFRNTDGTDPPWCRSELSTVDVSHDSTSLLGYGVLTTTGAANDIPLSTTLI